MERRIHRTMMASIALAVCTTPCLASVKTTLFRVCASVVADWRASIHALASDMADKRVPPDVQYSANVFHAIAIESRSVQLSVGATRQTVALATINA